MRKLLLWLPPKERVTLVCPWPSPDTGLSAKISMSKFSYPSSFGSNIKGKHPIYFFKETFVLMSAVNIVSGRIVCGKASWHHSTERDVSLLANTKISEHSLLFYGFYHQFLVVLEGTCKLRCGRVFTPTTQNEALQFLKVLQKANSIREITTKRIIQMIFGNHE